MPKAASRPSFATSSSDFALPPSSSSSSAVASTSSVTLDEPNVLLQRFRRPSLLVPKVAYLSESRLHNSPLASSFTFHSRRRSQSGMFNEESESDRERMSTDSSSGSSGNPTPMRILDPGIDESKHKPKLSRPPSTPPRKLSLSSAGMDIQDAPLPGRRFSFPIRPPRILNLLAESRPDESEVKSEAAFQRLVTSCSELPSQPRTPRPVTDRGRYPEEAGREESQREDTPSDDEDHLDEGPFAFSAPCGSEPIPIKTPRATSNGNNDDLNMSISETSSVGALSMDVDLPPCSPSLATMMSTPINAWRYTPPPTTSAVRSNKRKLDDRFDPYPSASKRRAVSPSLSYLRDAHPTVGSPMNGRNGRLPISIPITIPNTTANSAASSPTIGAYPGSFSRSVSITSSPTLRSSMLLASPILRPIPRLSKRGEEEEKEVDGAGEAVGGLTLG